MELTSLKALRCSFPNRLLVCCPQIVFYKKPSPASKSDSNHHIKWNDFTGYGGEIFIYISDKSGSFSPEARDILPQNARNFFRLVCKYYIKVNVSIRC